MLGYTWKSPASLHTALQAASGSRLFSSLVLSSLTNYSSEVATKHGMEFQPDLPSLRINTFARKYRFDILWERCHPWAAGTGRLWQLYQGKSTGSLSQNYACSSQRWVTLEKVRPACILPCQQSVKVDTSHHCHPWTAGTGQLWHLHQGKGTRSLSQYYDCPPCVGLHMKKLWPACTLPCKQPVEVDASHHWCYHPWPPPLTRSPPVTGKSSSQTSIPYGSTPSPRSTCLTSAGRDATPELLGQGGFGTSIKVRVPGLFHNTTIVLPVLGYKWKSPASLHTAQPAARGSRRFSSLVLSSLTTSSS